MSYTSSSPSQMAVSNHFVVAIPGLSFHSLSEKEKKEPVSLDLKAPHSSSWKKVTTVAEQKTTPLNASSKGRSQSTLPLSSRHIVSLSSDSSQQQKFLQELMVKRARYQKMALEGHPFPFLGELLDAIEHQLKSFHLGDELAAEQFHQATELFEKLWNHVESIFHPGEHTLTVLIAKAKAYFKAGHRARETSPPRITKKTS